MPLFFTSGIVAWYARLSNGNFCILIAASLNDAEYYHGIGRINMAFSIDDRAELKCLCQLSLSLLDAPLFEPRSGHAHRQPYRFWMRATTDRYASLVEELGSEVLQIHRSIPPTAKPRKIFYGSNQSDPVVSFMPVLLKSRSRYLMSSASWYRCCLNHVTESVPITLAAP